MKAFRRVCGLALVLVLVACTEANPYLTILYNKAPDEQCLVSDEEGGLIYLRGTLDLGSGGALTYDFHPLVANHSFSTEDPARNVISIFGADIELLPGTSARSAQVLPLSFDRFRTQRTFDTIAPGDVGLAEYPLVDGTQYTALAGAVAPGEIVTIIARTRVFGTVNTNDIASGWIDYPIDLCVGCVGPAACFPYQL